MSPRVGACLAPEPGGGRGGSEVDPRQVGRYGRSRADVPAPADRPVADLPVWWYTHRPARQRLRGVPRRRAGRSRAAQVGRARGPARPLTGAAGVGGRSQSVSATER